MTAWKCKFIANSFSRIGVDPENLVFDNFYIYILINKGQINPEKDYKNNYVSLLLYYQLSDPG